MTKEEIRLKAVENAKEYEVWPPIADYQDGLIKGFEDGAEWMLDNPTGGALLYAVEKTAERTKREVMQKAIRWLEEEMDFRGYSSDRGSYGGIKALGTYDSLEEFIDDFKQAMEE